MIDVYFVDDFDDDDCDGDSDRFDTDTDSMICPYCGEPIFEFDGEWVCDSCGPLDEDELEDE